MVGFARRCRSRALPGRGASVSRAVTGTLAVLTAAALVTGCDPVGATGGSDAGVGSTGPSADPSRTTACTRFFGDADYHEVPAWRVLEGAAVIAGTAGTGPSDGGPSDGSPATAVASEVETSFADAPEDTREAASDVATWLRTAPASGQHADLDTFAVAWQGLAESCTPDSTAATWTAGHGQQGAKPAALVCAETFTAPSTLSVFADRDQVVPHLTAIAGASPQTVPASAATEVAEASDLLTAQSVAVDDPAVAAALREVRTPFQDALQGDLDSPGLHDPLTELGAACTAAGYDVPDPLAGTDTDPSDGGTA